VIIDRYVQPVPASPPALGCIGASDDPLADRPEAAELLGVDVQEFARPGALIAHA
jgi:hypothetical protein